MRSTDAKHTTSLSTHDSFGDLDRRAFARGLGVRRASRRSSRFGDPLALPAGGILPRGGSPRATRLWCPRHRRSSRPAFARRPRHPRLREKQLHALSRVDIYAFARCSRNVGQDRFRCPFVKKEQLRRSEAPSIDRRPTTTAPLRMPFRRSAPISRFCHRDSAPDATSPGAVSRFGLAPVHHAYENTRAASLGIDVVERLLQHDTKSGHTFERSSHLARVDRPKPGHAFLSTLRRLCSRRLIERGCERHGLPLARKFSLSAMPLFRDSSGPRASLARDDVPAERTESEECRAPFRRKRTAIEPQLDASRAPVVIDACAWGLESHHRCAPTEAHPKAPYPRRANAFW